MPLAEFDSTIPAAFDNIQIVLTLAVFIVMITLVSLCTCCGNVKQTRKEETDDCDYGVVTVAAVSNSINKQPVHTVNFRENTSKRPQDRHSQPVTKMNHMSFNRQSAPGRALPKLPADLYTAIDKKPKADDIRFADETINPMYECIDAETDSFVDPLYSKVGAPGTSKDIRYDYPIFSGRPKEDMVYQSASQIYAAGSEDPYSSITSERERNTTFVDKDGDNSSTYDPGYAKVNLNNKPKIAGKQQRIERSERELDLLYSKIRRNVPNYDDQPGPSRIEPILPTQPTLIQNPNIEQFDEQQSAVSSREPSYRYITMRESADVLRERLRQQGQLDRPIREHYYSTIGNEYETIANRAEPLIVTTISPPPEVDIPPPPTSPIPERSRPVSFIEPIPSPPDLRCSPVPPKPVEQTFSIKNRTEEPLTFRSLETLIGRRTMEEKEVIIEQKSIVAVGVPIPSTSYSSTNNIMSRSMDNSWSSHNSNPVHEVTIRRLDRPYEGPSVDSIISGRRYRSGQGLALDDKAVDPNESKEQTTPEKPENPSAPESARPKRKTSRQESEEEKIRRLGTIYTGNDYVSSVDLTAERPWPMNNQ
ncbi:unnamed protein product [Caenorhabditis angaria]|uniref:Uncharacterized protein n=1 Tax=Caenorhabditis angaria TaxID=860376 RepID=A0A9P1J484_9PELO|nr:unnamed protein product [Caenorhabditis angaria]